MPACARDGEEIEVVADVSQDVESGVVLEEQIHLDGNASNVLEHVGELHVLRV